MTTRQLYHQLQIHMKAMHMEFKLVILQLMMAIPEKIYDRLLTDIILDYATRLYKKGQHDIVIRHRNNELKRISSSKKGL